MQSFRQLEQTGSIAARRSGKHHRKAGHEEGRTQGGPSVRLGHFLGAQIHKAFFQVPMHLCWKVAV